MALVEQLILTGGFCVLCGYHLDPRNIEMHHIAGRKYGDLTIPVCHNCHQSLSRMQYHRMREVTPLEQSPDTEMALFLRGLSDIQLLSSQHLRNLSDQIFDSIKRRGD